VCNPVLRLGSMLSVVVAGWLAGSVLRNFSGTAVGQRFGSVDVIFAVSGVLMIAAAGYAAFALRPQAVAEQDAPAVATPEPPVAAGTR